MPKRGDLVRWTYPGDIDIGVVIGPWRDGSRDVLIHWFKAPERSGPYPPEHKYMEVVSESR